MTGEAWAVVAGVVVTGLINWGLLSYYLGGVAERVRNQGTWLTDLEKAKDDHEKRISRVEGRLGLRPE